MAASRRLSALGAHVVRSAAELPPTTYTTDEGEEVTHPTAQPATVPGAAGWRSWPSATHIVPLTAS